MSTPINRPELTVSLSGTPTVELKASEGSVSLDYSRIPYGVADLDVPLTDSELIGDIDPRTAPRVIIGGSAAGHFEALPDSVGSEGEVVPGGSVWVSNDSRTLDLHLREMEVDHQAKVIRLIAATDEGLLTDYAPLTDDWTPYDSRTSLRAVCNYVLGVVIPGKSLETGPDSNVTPRWEQTNLIANARGTTDATGWTASLTGGSATVNTVSTTITPEGAAVNTALRLNLTGTTTANSLLRYGGVGSTVKPSAGRIYTLSAFVYQDSGTAKNGRLILRYLNDAGATLKDFTLDQSLASATWAKLSVTGLAPIGTAAAFLYVGVNNGMPTGTTVRVTAAVMAEGTRNDVWFDGARADDAAYTYDWTPDALTTPSIRVPVGDAIEPEALCWRGGQTAWDFLENLTNAVGRRLYCDEGRRWHLINPEEFAAEGLLTLGPDNSTEATDALSRDDEETWATGVRVTYTWTDSQGLVKTRAAIAGVAGKVRSLERNGAYPGNGFAQAVLARMTGQGRTQAVTALADWTATPGQEARIQLPGTPEQVGQVTGVEWQAADGTMRVNTKALTTAIPGSYLAWPTTTYTDTADAVTYASL